MKHVRKTQNCKINSQTYFHLLELPAIQNRDTVNIFDTFFFTLLLNLYRKMFNLDFI